jgi:hypothetical protein
MKRFAVLLAAALATFVGTTSIPPQATGAARAKPNVRAAEEAYSLCQVARPLS